MQGPQCVGYALTSLLNCERGNSLEQNTFGVGDARGHIDVTTIFEELLLFFDSFAHRKGKGE